jgi:hypothetical protein
LFGLFVFRQFDSSRSGTVRLLAIIGRLHNFTFDANALHIDLEETEIEDKRNLNLNIDKLLPICHLGLE